jgi:hypothetical protein
MDAVQAAVTKHAIKLVYERPNGPICTKIVECLDHFADADRGRYVNFATLRDPNLGNQEPILLWWDQVAKLILEKHYDERKQERAEAQANLVAQMMSPAIVLQTDEMGHPIRDVASASVRSSQNDIVRQWGRYYALTIVRWLASALSELASEACHEHGAHAFFGVWEYLQTYALEDSLLRRYKIWPLKMG